MKSDPFARYGLTRIINASGTETIRGASPVCAEVLEAVNALVPHSVDMLELQSVACRTIASAFAAEAGVVVNSTAAGIAVAVAACMTGQDPAAVERLPDTTGLKNEVILQRGHHVNYGASITQNIAVSGAAVVPIGTATDCGAYQLAGAITPRTAAALYVISHHTVQSGLIDLKTFCRECHRQKVPVIVDAAAEPDPRPYLRAGADLVIVSLHKNFASLTGGAIAGRLALVRACLFQEKGIGRPMKVGKEGVIAGIAALERWSALNHRQIGAELDARLARAQRRLNRVRGLAARIELDSTSRRFSRLLLEVDPVRAGLSAAELASALAKGSPSIAVRSLNAELGQLQVDLRRASDQTANLIATRVEKIVAARRPTRRPAPVPLPRNGADAGWERVKGFPVRVGRAR